MNETTIPEEEIREAWNATHRTTAWHIHKAEWELVFVKGHHDCLAPFVLVEVDNYRSGYLAHAAKHAEKCEKMRVRLWDVVAGRDAEIERWREHTRKKILTIQELEESLTAAREREEKLKAELFEVNQQALFDSAESDKINALLKKFRRLKFRKSEMNAQEYLAYHDLCEEARQLKATPKSTAIKMRKCTNRIHNGGSTALHYNCDWCHGTMEVEDYDAIRAADGKEGV